MKYKLYFYFIFLNIYIYINKILNNYIWSVNFNFKRYFINSSFTEF